MTTRHAASLLPFLWLMLGAAGETPPAGKPVFRITGTVVNRRDGTPIGHCRLTVTQAPSSDAAEAASGPGADRPGGRQRLPRASAPQAQGTESAYSDDTGHFSLTVPTAGVWRLTGTARGFHAQSYDQQENFWSGVVLSTARPEITVRFAIYPDSSIMGIVYDEAGEPVRNAQVRVEPIRPAGSNEGLRRRAQVAVARTDDRGRYETPELNPGDYRLAVNAQPWYATGRSANRGATSTGASPDPSLDLVYAETWFPAAAERDSSDVISLAAGEEREADFHLTPIPSIHLHLPMPQPVTDGGDASTRMYTRIPYVQREGGSQGANPVTTSINGQELDIGGLTPGTYQVRTPDAGSRAQQLSTLTVSSGSPAVVGASSIVTATTLAVSVDGVEGEDVRQVSLVDAASRRSYTTARQEQRPAGDEDDDDHQTGTRTISAPAGRYEVFLQGRPGLYLTGLSATGAKVEGRTIEFAGGSPKLLIHAAIGLGEVIGVAKKDGTPLPGAMILLVPAGYGQTRNVAPLRRNETNTDGSFDLRNVFPGEYILVAIDHGWGVNWRDSATLDSYLTRGTPINLQAAATVRSNPEGIEP